MNDLYSLSQIIKSHPLYAVHRDEIHQLYLSLSREGRLQAAGVMAELRTRWPELHEALHKNHALFKQHCEETVKLQLQGVQFAIYGEVLYPAMCYRMTDPPLTLSYIGAPAWLNDRTLSVVGSREPAADSLLWMEKELAAFCEQVKPCIVSGGARGVDQKAHSVALRKGCSTVVVLPSGLGEIYPASLREWMPLVMEQGGCFLSEYDYQQKMHKHLFHHRNRLIAALGQASLLVEARRRSGTLITASQAVQLGRPVWVVPGHPLDMHFLGGLDLLLDGAQLVRDAQDLFMFFHEENVSAQMSPVGVAAL
ncbi:DNA-protecting protein DprA [Bdellovibrio bacteriovorus]|uniref:DNA-processing protein DprA n=1 Tax=Bdellovibrio bacteriovorus TaxID=959 RepID=UPI0021CE0EC0|nr:DNA-processing protein DprA [Bdellovibrio bacteriovorus]UXR63149.1 DNA-protecting protein DprA [Bdellovibrio bacteriovorus]